MDTSVGRGCFAIVGEDFIGRFCVLESDDREHTNPGLSFLLVGHRGIPGYMLLLLLFCWYLMEPPLFVSFVLCVRSGGLRVFLTFCAPYLSDLFPWSSKVRLVLAVWGATLLVVGHPSWASARDVAENLLCFWFLLLLQLAAGS